MPVFTNSSTWVNLHTVVNQRLVTFRNRSQGVATVLGELEQAAIPVEIVDQVDGSGAYYDTTARKIMLGASTILLNPRRNYGRNGPVAAAALTEQEISECAETVVFEALNWKAQADYGLYDIDMKSHRNTICQRGRQTSDREADVTYDHCRLMKEVRDANPVIPLSAFSTRNLDVTDVYLIADNKAGYRELIANERHEPLEEGQLISRDTELPTKLLYYFNAFGTFTASSALVTQLKKVLVPLSGTGGFGSKAPKEELPDIHRWISTTELTDDGLDRRKWPHFWAVMVSVLHEITKQRPKDFRLDNPNMPFTTEMWTLAKQNPLTSNRLERIQITGKPMLGKIKLGGKTLTVTADGAKIA